MENKVKHAKELIAESIEKFPRLAIACSFGKDSIVAVHIAREIDPEIKVFSVMTRYKPKETFEYLRLMNEKMALRTTVYIVADKVPEILTGDSLEVILLPTAEFKQAESRIESQNGDRIYAIDPDECCRLLKIEPTRAAVAGQAVDLSQLE